VTLGALAWSILAAWLMGDNAARSVHRTVEQRARQIDHAFSLGIALVIGVCRIGCSRVARLRISAALSIEQANWLRRAMFRAWVNVFDGYWRAARQSERPPQLRQGMDEWAATGSRSGYGYQRLLLIEVYLRVGEIAAAQQAADEALAFIEQSGNRLYEAELYRLRGEVAAVRGDRGEAEACFQHAIEVANAQVRSRGGSGRSVVWRSGSDGPYFVADGFHPHVQRLGVAVTGPIGMLAAIRMQMMMRVRLRRRIGMISMEYGHPSG
jgi:tetratricopeptide (TPR) repeat protein